MSETLLVFLVIFIPVVLLLSYVFVDSGKRVDPKTGKKLKRGEIFIIPEDDKDEKETLINLFLRLEVDEIVIEKEMTKGKNKQVKIRLKDVEVIMKEQRFINVNVKNID
jgi:hypothetical protein